MKRWLLIIPIMFIVIIVIDYRYIGSYLLNIIFNTFLISVLFYWFIRKIHLATIRDFIFASLFFIYLIFVHIMVTWLQLFPLSFGFQFSPWTINLIPFKTLWNTWAMVHIPGVYWKQFIGNVFLLTPLGYVVLRLKIVQEWIRATGLVFLFTVGIEVVQLLKSTFLDGSRSTDIDDVILNTVGGMIGIVVYIVIEKVKEVYSAREITY